jgi:hypothetical protein
MQIQGIRRTTYVETLLMKPINELTPKTNQREKEDGGAVHVGCTISFA